MKNGVKVFDADMHIMEDLKFVEYMDPEYRDRGPKAAPADESFPDFTASTLEGISLSGPAHIYPTPEMRPNAALSRKSFAEGMAKYVEGRADGFGPKSQMLALDTEGIDIAALYPSSTILELSHTQNRRPRSQAVGGDMPGLQRLADGLLLDRQREVEGGSGYAYS